MVSHESDSANNMLRVLFAVEVIVEKNVFLIVDFFVWVCKIYVKK